MSNIEMWFRFAKSIEKVMSAKESLLRFYIQMFQI